MTVRFSRRQLLGGGVLIATGWATTTLSAEPERVTEDDPMASALGYKHRADDVDVEKFPKRATEEGLGQNCANCSLYINGEDSDASWAPCSIFQNKLVAAEGWCNAWIPKPAA